MADTPETDKLVKKEAEGPAPDPITVRSTSAILLVCALLLTGTLAWALWDEVYGQRPWKDMQSSFVKRYNRYLKRLKKKGFASEEEVRARAEYQDLDRATREAEQAIQPDLKEYDRHVALIDRQLAAISDEFQDRRGRITVKNYEIEVADEGEKADLRREVQEMRTQKASIRITDDTGATREQKLDYGELESLYNKLKRDKADVLFQRGEKLKPVVELKRQRDEYLKNNVAGVTEEQVNRLLAKNENFEVTMRQINVQGDTIVDRCETCHLGIREPIDISAGDMMPANKRTKPDELARAFVSHPNKELLQIHDPEKFGCASCHGGNGRATTNVEKGHGRHRFWLHPLYETENVEAGCQQCHSQDRVLVGSGILNRGKDLFSERGCVGCHRYEGYDRETDALTSARQEIKQLDEQIAANHRESLNITARKDEPGISDEENARLLSRIDGLKVSSSQLESRKDQLAIQARYLMMDQKKVGPNLKDVRLKLRKEFIPEWLKDPQAFRPGTKMPTYWYLSRNEHENEERRAIAAYLWQSSFGSEYVIQKQPFGDPANGQRLFETRGCLACHSVGDGEGQATFAANLQRVGEKANYDYIVRWVHNPRERTAPFCPKEGKDIPKADYDKKGWAYVFDANHSKCPNDGEELQIQNMTVMPNFRLSDSDARDIATYLVNLSPRPQYAVENVSYMDTDTKLADRGKELIKQYGCAGCHEIRGFESEQRIGKELTSEGSTPLERLDFALMTDDAEDGKDPLQLHPERKEQHWYDHKGFFEHKIQDPSVYDQGKEREPGDHLRMPRPYMTPEWRNALTTFLLGSKGTEGANVPTSLFYNASNREKDIQEGWWVIKKYNCMGCHQIQVGQERSAITKLPWYREEGEYGKRQWPPGLMTEGARVDPAWLLRFLRDPSLSGISEEELTSAVHGVAGAGGRVSPPASPARGDERSQTPATGEGAQRRPPNGGAAAASSSGPPLPAQPGENRNGVRRNLEIRMPTFNFSPNELRILVRFFMAYASQQDPYIRERQEPLTDEEVNVARLFLTEGAQPCLSCHLTGDPVRDKTAYAPSFFDAAQRLKPEWTLRWILDPPKIMPDTTMPGELFEMKEGRHVLRASVPPEAAAYQGDHALLLVRYILQMSEQEQATLAARERAAQARKAQGGGQQPAAPAASAHAGWRNFRPPPTRTPPREQRAVRGKGRQRVRRVEVSMRAPPWREHLRARAPNVPASARGGAGGFSP